jgi:hypothetical protein
MPNEQAIKFLSELKDDACVVIFTRDDAETQLPEDRDFITDEEWQAMVRDFDNGFLNDDHWLEFGDIVNRNLDSNPESE